MVPGDVYHFIYLLLKPRLEGRVPSSPLALTGDYDPGVRYSQTLHVHILLLLNLPTCR